MARGVFSGAIMLGSLGLLAPPAHAETTKAFQVSADIVRGCVVAVNGSGQWGRIDFGTVSGVAQGTVDADLVGGAAVGGIQIDCTPNTTAYVAIDNGDHPANGLRQMALDGSAARIPYQLFADGGSTPWGSQSVTISFPPGTSRRLLPLRGQAMLTRPMKAGAYVDTVRVTLTW